MKLKYYVLNVFSTEKYKGNQLSVVLLENDLTLKQYHQISREFGYSETSFIYYSENEGVLKVRSFTPGEFEVNGAGHNLLGAVCLALLNKMDIFKKQNGKSYVNISGTIINLKVTENDGLPYVAMKQKSVQIGQSLPKDEIAYALGLKPEDLTFKTCDVVIGKTEVAHLMVPISNLSSLYKANPTKVKLKEISEKYNFEGFYLFTLNELNSEYLTETRFFNPGMGIDEDPATGTAAGPMMGYLEHLGLIQKNKEYKILQGVQVKHPSTIIAKVTDDGIWISGSSVIVMEGEIYL